MAQNIFSNFGSLIESKINRLNPAASFNTAPINPKQDWLKGSLAQLRARVAAAEQERLQRERWAKEEEERQAILFEVEKKKQSKLKSAWNKFTSLDDKARDVVDGPTSAAKRKLGSGFGNTMNALNAASEFTRGGITAPYGDLEAGPDGQIRRRYSWESALEGLKEDTIGGLKGGGMARDRIARERALRERAGIKHGNVWDEFRGQAAEFDQSNLPVGVKVGANIALDPTNLVGVGFTGKLAKATKLAKAGEKSRVLGRTGRIAGGLIEGPGSAKSTLAIAGGAGLAAEAADRAGFGDTGLALASLAGGMAGGMGAGLLDARGLKNDIMSPKSAPRNRPIIPNSRKPDFEEVPHPGGVVLRSKNGLSAVIETAEDGVDARSQRHLLLEFRVVERPQ